MAEIFGKLCDLNGECVCEKRRAVFRATMLGAELNAKGLGLTPVYAAEAALMTFLSITGENNPRETVIEHLKDAIRLLNESLEPDGKFMAVLDMQEASRARMN